MNTEKDYFFRVGPKQTFIRGGDETHHLWTGPNPIYEFAEEGWCLDCSSFAVKRLQNAIEKGLIDLSKDENKNWGFSYWILKILYPVKCTMCQLYARIAPPCHQITPEHPIFNRKLVISAFV